MALWTDKSTNWDGKQLKAVVRIDENHIVEATLYYSREYEEVKNSYGVTMREPTGTYRIVLNASAMRKDGDFYSGGLGKTYELAKGFKRRTIKELNIVAGRFGDAELIAASQGDTAPTLIVGGRAQ